MMMRLRSLGARFRSDRRGVAAFELALVLPVVLTLVIGTAEVGGYYLVHQNLNSAAAQVGNLVTQQEKLTSASLNGMLAGAKHLVDQSDFQTSGTVIITAITADAAKVKKIAWQRRGGGTLAQTSRFGTPGSVVAALPGFTMNANETVIVVELFYNYGGSGMGVIPATLLRKVSFARGRIGELSTLSAS